MITTLLSFFLTAMADPVEIENASETLAQTDIPPSLLRGALVMAQPPQEPNDPAIPNWGGAIKYEENEAPVLPKPLPYSPVVEANGVLYLAGHIGRDPETRALAGEIQAEAKQTLENIGATLESVGATYADVVRCQVFLADIEDFAAMNDVYRTFFPTNPPARSTMAVKDIVIGAKIEIECTAVRGHGAREE